MQGQSPKVRLSRNKDGRKSDLSFSGFPAGRNWATIRFGDRNVSHTWDGSRSILHLDGSIDSVLVSLYDYIEVEIHAAPGV